MINQHCSAIRVIGFSNSSRCSWVWYKLLGLSLRTHTHKHTYTRTHTFLTIRKKYLGTSSCPLYSERDPLEPRAIKHRFGGNLRIQKKWNRKISRSKWEFISCHCVLSELRRERISENTQTLAKHASPVHLPGPRRPDGLSGKELLHLVSRLCGSPGLETEGTSCCSSLNITL